MPILEYTLIINGSIEVDNSIHMLNYEGQLKLITDDVNFNRNVDMQEVNDIEFNIIEND